MNKIEKFLFKKGQSIWDNYDYLTALEVIREIIKALNNVIDETNTIEEIVTSLQNWLNSLDFQEEINIKLDEMVADGTLAQIINEEIFSELYDKTSYYIVAEKFGAIGDGVTDDSAAIQEALNYCNTNKLQLRLLNKVYLIKKSLILPNVNVHIIGGNESNIGHKYGVTFERKDLKTVIKADGDFPALVFNGHVWSCSIEGLAITNSVTHRGIGIQINNGNNWIQELILKGVSLIDNNIGLEVNMGDSVSTHSGFVYSLFDKCIFAGNKSHGIYLRQTVLNTKTWFNQNSFNNCQFSENGVGFEIERVSVQNLSFNLCSFESNGFTSNDSGFRQAFGFKAQWLMDASFKECYFESNLPYKRATESDIINFTTNGTQNSYGNYVLGNEEYVTYNKTIRPLGELPRGMYGEIIVDGKDIGPKVVIQDCLFSLNYIYVTLLRAGTCIMRDNLFFQNLASNRRPTNALKSVIHLKNSTVNNSYIDCTGNVFSGSVVGVEKILEVDGVLDNETVLKGQLITSSLLRHMNVSAYSIEGVNRIYVDSVSGNDNNIGVLPDYPLKSLNKALDKASLIKGNAIVELKGTFPVDSILRVRDMNVTLYGGGTANITTPLYSTSGFLYFDVLNSNIKLQSVNVYLVKDTTVTGFIFNYLFRVQGTSSIVLENVNISSNDVECHISNILGGVCSLTGLSDNTFSGIGKLYKKTDSAIVGYSGISNWL